MIAMATLKNGFLWNNLTSMHGCRIFHSPFLSSQLLQFVLVCSSLVRISSFVISSFQSFMVRQSLLCVVLSLDKIYLCIFILSLQRQFIGDIVAIAKLHYALFINALEVWQEKLVLISANTLNNILEKVSKLHLLKLCSFHFF